MAIMSNPPPKGMIGRAVKPLAWRRSERAPTDPALTAALTRCGTESGSPGIVQRRPSLKPKALAVHIFRWIDALSLKPILSLGWTAFHRLNALNHGAVRVYRMSAGDYLALIVDAFPAMSAIRYDP
jgi:hypothetical protein